MNKETKDKIAKIISKDQDTQIIVAIEELSELQKPLCKYLRGATLEELYYIKQSIEEELADVELMLEQIKMIFNISNRNINKRINAKVDRTIKRYMK